MILATLGLLGAPGSVSADPGDTSEAPQVEQPQVEQPQVEQPLVEQPLVELEVPSLPGCRPRPEGKVQAAVEDEGFARWNVGGKSDPAYPSSRPGFHPGARVVVDATVAGAWGRQGSAATLRRQVEARVRSAGYWPLRICYEAALRRDAELTVDHRMRWTVGGRGRVTAASSLSPLDDTELDRCLGEAALGLKLKALPARRVDTDLRIRLWPGDAPLPASCEQSCVESDSPELRAVLAEAQGKWHAAHAKLTRCAEEGRARDSKLWGRIALWVEFDSAGTVQDSRQYESRFPDPQVARCVAGVLGGLRLTHKPSGPLVLALRIGAFPRGHLGISWAVALG